MDTTSSATLDTVGASPPVEDTSIAETASGSQTRCPAPWPAVFGCIGFACYVTAIMVTRPISPDAADSSLKGQLVGVAIIAILGLPFAGTLLRRLAEGSRRSSMIFHLFWAVTLLMLPFGVAPIYSLLYLVLTFGVYFCVGSVWMAPPWLLRTTFLAVSAVCYYVCIRTAATFDLNPGRHLGLLTPNHFAAFALAPVLLSFAQPRLLQFGIYALSLILILFINARGALLSFWIYVAGYEAARTVIAGGRKHLVFFALLAGIAAPVAATACLADAPLGERVLSALKSSLAWDDPGRGVHSGFTGRAYGWSAENLQEHLVTGAGFRSAKYIGGAHSAWYSLARDSGVVGTGLFVLFIAVRFLQLARSVLWRELSTEARLEAAGVMAATAAIMFIAIFELWLLNIGFPIGACALLLYSYYEPLPSELPTSGGTEGLQCST